MMNNDIRLEYEYDAAIEKVWRAITNRESLADWLMPNNFKADIGHRFRFTGKPMPGWRGYVECEVVEVDPPRKLSFTWKGDDDWTQPTLVSFKLRENGTKTLLVLEHTGFIDSWGENASSMLRGGWKGLLGKRLLDCVQNQ